MKCSKLSLCEPKRTILIKLPRHKAAMLKAFIKTFSILVRYLIVIVQLSLILYTMGQVARQEQ